MNGVALLISDKLDFNTKNVTRVQKESVTKSNPPGSKKSIHICMQRKTEPQMCEIKGNRIKGRNRQRVRDVNILLKIEKSQITKIRNEKGAFTTELMKTKYVFI